MLPSTVFQILLLIDCIFVAIVTFRYGNRLGKEPRITTVQDSDEAFMPMYQQENYHQEARTHIEIEVEKPLTYNFVDPETAYLILQQLDVYEPVADSYHNNYTQYKKPFIGLNRNNAYCDRHRKYFTENSNRLFEDINYYTDFSPESIMRNNVISAIGNDIHPEVSTYMPRHLQNQSIIDLKPEINIFYSMSHIQNHLRIGQQYSCLSQSSNDIPGRDRLNRKDYIAAAVTEYAKNFEDRPHCFNYDKFFPVT